MKTGEIYTTTKHNHDIIIVSDDFTGLNRGIVYAQYLDRRTIKITKEMLLEDKNLLFHTFAIWDCDWEEYTLKIINTEIKDTKWKN